MGKTKPQPTAVTASNGDGTAMLTDAAIRKAVKSQHIQILSDGGRRGSGRLVLMVRPSMAEWYAQRFENGRKRLTKLGNFPDLSLQDAREEYRNG